MPEIDWDKELKGDSGTGIDWDKELSASPKPPPKIAAPSAEVSALDKPIPSGTLPGPAGALADALSALGITPRGTLHALPAIGAGAATLATGGAAAPALLPAMAAAGLGGAGGSFLSQGAEAALGGEAHPTAGGVLGEAGKEGLIQGALEPVGAAVGGVGKLVGKGLSKLAEPALGAAGRMAESLGLPPAMSGIPKYLLEHTWMGQRIAHEAETKGVDKAAAALAEQARILNVPPPPPGLGAADLAAWTRGALKSSADNRAEEVGLFKAAEQARKEATAATNAAAASDYSKFTKGETAAFKQATTEGVAAGKSGIIQEALQKKTAAEADKALTISLGKKAAENVRMKLSGQVDQELLSIGANLEPEFVGLAAKGAVERGSAIGARQAKDLYGAADAALEGASVPASDSLRETLLNVRDRMSANPAMHDSVLADVVGRFLGNPEKGKLGLLDLPQMPFAQVRELQKAVASRMPGFGAQVSRDSQGLAKYLWRDLTSAMEEGTAGTPGGEALKVANDYYRGYMGVMKRGFIPKVLKTSPEFVVDILKDADVTRPRLLREAILGYAEKYGTLQEKVEAREAWSTLQANYLRKRLFKGGPEKLAENLDAVGSPVIKELFETGPHPGTVRLYRGQPGMTPDYIRTSKTVQGRWFTPYKDSAEHYAAPHVGSTYGGEVVQVDVPENTLKGWGFDAGDPRSGFAGPFSKLNPDDVSRLRAYEEVVVPREIANQATKVTGPPKALTNLRRIGDTLQQLGPRMEALTAAAEARATGATTAASAGKAQKLATLKKGVPAPPTFPDLVPVPFVKGAPPPIPPEVLQAQGQTSLLGDALSQSHAAQKQASGIGGLSALGHTAMLGPVAMGMHFFGAPALAALPAMGASEMLGGLIAKAIYSPARTQALVSALFLMSRQGAAGAARLAALELEWSGRAPAKRPSKPTYFPDLSKASAPPPPPSSPELGVP